MTTIASITPCSSLAPNICSYKLISFNTRNRDLIHSLHATPAFSLIFFLKDHPVFLKNNFTAACSNSASNVWLQGISDQVNGLMKCNGDYLTFLVRFTVTGFYKLFKLAPSTFTNKILPADEILGKNVVNVFKQLQNAGDIFKMAELADQFFKAFISKQNAAFVRDEITPVSDDMFKTKSSLPIAYYANKANMSLRNFERKFIEQAGISPKVYCSLLRFDSAMQLKLHQPEKSWAGIACECGYYDQMHMIRDCKKFAGESPARLLERIAALPVEHIYVTKKEVVR